MQKESPSIGDVGSRYTFVYCTNIWNHYQSQVCYELRKILGERFRMCLFQSVPAERRLLGWEVEKPPLDWVLGPPRNEADLRHLEQVVCDADVAVLGDTSQALQLARVSTNKLTFISSERLWKRPFAAWRMLNPRFALGIRKYKKLANRPNVHYLSMGAYAAGDVRRIGAYGDRIWTWGYFAEVNAQAPVSRNNSTVRILWIGRMLKWKRVDVLLRAFALVNRLDNQGELLIFGDGPEKKRLKNLADKLGLNEKCNFHEPVNSHEVRTLMQGADIFVLASDRNEGWGVVANEAMSEGAILVANREAGSAPILIKHERTGLLFSDGDIKDLARALEALISDETLRRTIRGMAWTELSRLWHPAVAAIRLVNLTEGLLGLGKVPEFTEGPCQKLVT